MNLHHLKLFHAVAHTENFSQAAERLFISQPAVSVQVRRLEEALGVALVEVYGRRVHLTEAGARLKVLADQLVRLEREIEETMAEFQDPGKGQVRVGASTTPGTYLMPRAMASFRRQHPGIWITLELGNTQTIEEKLLANDLDLGIVGEDITKDSGLVLEPWLYDRLVVVAPADHALARAGTITAAELAKEPLIMREPGSSTREVFMSQIRARGLEIRPMLELSSTEAIKEAAASGLGLGVVSELAALQEMRTGRLRVLDVPEVRLERQLHLAFHRSKRLSLAGGAFLRFLRESGMSLTD